LLGTEEQWDAFETAWTALLAQPLPGKPPLTQFHLAPCRAGYGEFRDYKEAERDRITYLFRRIILDIGFVTLAVAVNRTAWNQLVTAELADQLGQPEELCLVRCIDLLMDTIRFRKPGEQVLILIDQGTKIAGIAFAPVPRVVALQGADMIATETYHYAQEWLRDRESAIANAHFREYLRRELTTGLIFDREHIQEVVQLAARPAM
jgi:hypothetical protein